MRNSTVRKLRKYHYSWERVDFYASRGEEKFNTTKDDYLDYLEGMTYVVKIGPSQTHTVLVNNSGIYLIVMWKDMSADVTRIGDTTEPNIEIYCSSNNKNLIMQDFQLRLQQEADELQERLIKLKNFIGTDKYYEIKQTQQDILKIQARSMETYLACLRARIKDLI